MSDSSCAKCGAKNPSRPQFKTPLFAWLPSKRTPPAAVCRSCHGQFTWKLALAVMWLHTIVLALVSPLASAPPLEQAMVLGGLAAVTLVGLWRLWALGRLRDEQRAADGCACGNCSPDAESPSDRDRHIHTNFFFLLAWLDHRIYLSRRCYRIRFYQRMLGLVAFGLAFTAPLVINQGNPIATKVMLGQCGIMLMVVVGRLWWVSRRRETLPTP